MVLLLGLGCGGLALAGPPTQIAIHAGHGQTALAGTAVATPPSVIVRDASNNPVAGVTVTFVALGPMACRPMPGPDVCAGRTTGATATTNANGIAAVGSWSLAFTPGENALTATAAGLSGATAQFTATGVAGAAAQMAIRAGNGQTAAPGAAVATPPSVVVRDVNSNPVAGVAVAFAAAPGSGTVSGAITTTDGNGVAAAGGWTLGPTPGSQTLMAVAAGAGVGPVAFTATASAATVATVQPVPGLRAPALVALAGLLLVVAARRAGRRR